MNTATAATAVAFINAFGAGDTDTMDSLLADDVIFETRELDW